MLSEFSGLLQCDNNYGTGVIRGQYKYQKTQALVKLTQKMQELEKCVRVIFSILPCLTISLLPDANGQSIEVSL